MYKQIRIVPLALIGYLGGVFPLSKEEQRSDWPIGHSLFPHWCTGAVMRLTLPVVVTKYALRKEKFIKRKNHEISRL